MESGNLVVGHMIKIHLLSEYRQDGHAYAVCGVRLDKVKKFSKKKRRATEGKSPIEAGYCLKCRHTHKLNLEYGVSSVPTT